MTLNSFHARSTDRIVLLMLVFSATLLAGCATATGSRLIPPPTYASGYFDRLPCVDRIGRCFDATIGGKPVSVIAQKSQFLALKAELATLNDHVREVYWSVDHTVDGEVALDVVTQANTMGAEHVGAAQDEPDVTVYPLDGQDLDSKPELVARNDVLVGGQPVVTQQETLTENYLPPGRYVFAIKHIGQKNWDRKWVFVTVK
ncbi:MAG: hypothetical protein V4805_03590 [Pseudomonadota bacterium]